MINLSPITSLSNLILVSPKDKFGVQPQNPPNADGSPSTAKSRPAILFHYEGDQAVSLNSDITDHYIEDNTAIGDQIALRPEEITTHGFVGELTDIAPDFLQPLKQAANKLSSVSAYVPALSTSAIRLYNEAFAAYQVANGALNSAASVLGAFGVGEVQNQQQKYFQQFYQYWKTRTLFKVQTPWAVFDDMAIKSIRAIQDGESEFITDFEVTFKKMRFASTLLIDGGNHIPTGRNVDQSGEVVDRGSGSLGPSITNAEF